MRRMKKVYGSVVEGTRRRGREKWIDAVSEPFKARGADADGAWGKIVIMCTGGAVCV